jgi:AcrR family transcriptional regulator
VGVATQSRPEGRRRRSDAERNIDAIVVAALRVLAERPTASMQELAEAAGVHRATVHRHFATRDDLLHAVRRRGLDELKALVDDPALSSGSPDVAIERLTRAALELGDRRRLYRVATLFDEASEQRAAELRRPLVALFARAQDAGAVRRDYPPTTFALAWGGLLLIALPQLASGALTLQAATEFMLAFLLEPDRVRDN